MEVLSRLLNAAANLNGFQFHPRCKKTKLTHLCFADDLLLFAHADPTSIDIYKAILMYFERLSGLAVNNSKSFIFFAGVNHELKDTILNQLRFQEGTLPITYLGVPLISSRLTPTHCFSLIQRISSRITSWTSRFLSFAGRLQLVKSVLYSMQAYWCSMFILPKKVIKSIEQICARFLWSGPELRKASSKVKWEDISLPYAEGGLGIKKGVEWNIALSAKHLWNVICNSGSLWVAWIKAHRLGNRSVWVVQVTNSCSWAWSQLLKIRDILKPLLKFFIGNGEKTSLWYDPWLPQGAICDIWGETAIREANSHSYAMVSDIISGHEWAWSNDTSPFIRSIWSSFPAPLIPNPREEDRIAWMLNINGGFSSSSLWQHLRIKKSPVSWHKAVWFPGHIPSHAFILWLAILNRLPTLSRMAGWGIDINPTCILCSAHEETRDHLFFECEFSKKVWEEILAMNGVHNSLCRWEEELKSLIDFKGKSLAAKIFKTSFAAAVYLIWKERNARMHQETNNSCRGICNSIIWHVMYKASNLRRGHLSNRDQDFCNRWGINLDSHNGLSN